MFGNKYAGLMDAIFRFRGTEHGTKTVRRAPEVVVPTAELRAALANRETYFASVGPLRWIR